MVKSSGAPVVLLVDGHSLLYRAYYALPPLTAADGTPTQAVYGFLTMLLRLIDDVRPEFVAVAFDAPGRTFRHEAFEGYKAHRPAMPDDLKAQVAWAREIVAALNIAVFELEGYEADDLLGTLADHAAEKGIAALVVTGDKDALQLAGPRVQVAVTRRGIRDVATYDADRVRAETGVPPERIPDLKGLVGDPSDNIPGVPGIGEKTAARLIAEYGSLEAALERADEIPGKAGAALREHRDAALMSKRLAAICRRAPVRVDWGALRRKEPQVERLIEAYRRLGFRSLLQALEKRRTSAGKKPQTPESPAGWAIRILCGADDVEKALESLPQDAEWIVDLTWRGRPVDGEPAGFAVAAAGERIFIPLDTFSPGDKESLMQGPLGNGLRRAPIVCYDAKSLLLLLEEAAGVEIQIRDDVMIQGYLCDAGRGGYSLEELAERRGIADPLPSECKDRSLSGEPSLAALRRLGMIEKLRPLLARELEEVGLAALYKNVELPLVRVLADMERAGVCVDVEALRRLSREFGERIDGIERSIYRRAGTEFNLNSPRQLAEVLYERLRLPVLRRTKSGPSTAAEVLEVLAAEHEIAAEILERRQLQKLKSAYADALPRLVREKTGRVHTSFNQAVAATGRLSSANPNLQNIPVRTEEGRRIRRTFVPKKGHVFVKADYSQIELRVLAHMAQDEAMIEAFRKGSDIHAETAAELFGVPPLEVTREQREAAKAINFGIVYGMSSFGLARGTGLSKDDAARFIERYFKRYPQVALYMQASVRRARELGYAETLFGRRRYLPDLASKNRRTRKAAERAAINMPIQGSAADIMKMAMVAVHRRLRNEELPAAVLLQVHDELVLECRERVALDVARLLKEEMEGAARLDAPLRVEVSTGLNWLDVEKIL